MACIIIEKGRRPNSIEFPKTNIASSLQSISTLLLFYNPCCFKELHPLILKFCWYFGFFYSPEIHEQGSFSLNDIPELRFWFFVNVVFWRFNDENNPWVFGRFIFLNER